MKNRSRNEEILNSTKILILVQEQMVKALDLITAAYTDILDSVRTLKRGIDQLASTRPGQEKGNDDECQESKPSPVPPGDIACPT